MYGRGVWPRTVGFHLGTLHDYFFSPRLMAKFEFPARVSNETCLNFLSSLYSEASHLRELLFGLSSLFCNLFSQKLIVYKVVSYI